MAESLGHCAVFCRFSSAFGPMTAFEALFREHREARRQLRRATTVRGSGPSTPSFRRAADRYAKASARLLREWDRVSRRLPACPIARTEADAVASGPIEAVEALVETWIEAGLVADPGIQPIAARETVRMVLRAQRSPISLG
jgi:hypothetical protein